LAQSKQEYYDPRRDAYIKRLAAWDGDKWALWAKQRVWRPIVLQWTRLDFSHPLAPLDDLTKTLKENPKVGSFLTTGILSEDGYFGAQHYGSFRSDKLYTGRLVDTHPLVLALRGIQLIKRSNWDHAFGWLMAQTEGRPEANIAAILFFREYCVENRCHSVPNDEEIWYLLRKGHVVSYANFERYWEAANKANRFVYKNFGCSPQCYGCRGRQPWSMKCID
jgi:hypothetical protein